MENFVSTKIKDNSININDERVTKMAALSKTEINEMFWEYNNLSHLGIVPVGYGHCTTNMWVILEKDKLPSKRCSKHGDRMMVYKTDIDNTYCKEGTLLYRCEVPGCLEKLYPLYAHHQLNHELMLENPPALLY